METPAICWQECCVFDTLHTSNTASQLSSRFLSHSEDKYPVSRRVNRFFSLTKKNQMKMTVVQIFSHLINFYMMTHRLLPQAAFFLLCLYIVSRLRDNQTVALMLKTCVGLFFFLPEIANEKFLTCEMMKIWDLVMTFVTIQSYQFPSLSSIINQPN